MVQSLGSSVERRCEESEETVLQVTKCSLPCARGHRTESQVRESQTMVCAASAIQSRPSFLRLSGPHLFPPVFCPLLSELPDPAIPLSLSSSFSQGPHPLCCAL